MTVRLRRLGLRWRGTYEPVAAVNLAWQTWTAAAEANGQRNVLVATAVPSHAG
jgi:hypothetical protein